LIGLGYVALWIRKRFYQPEWTEGSERI